RVGYENHVAGIDERRGDMGNALLRADKRYHLAVGIESHLEAALVPAGDRRAELGQAVVIGVTVPAVVGHRLLRGLHDGRCTRPSVVATTAAAQAPVPHAREIPAPRSQTRTRMCRSSSISQTSKFVRCGKSSWCSTRGPIASSGYTSSSPRSTKVTACGFPI